VIGADDLVTPEFFHKTTTPRLVLDTPCFLGTLLHNDVLDYPGCELISWYWWIDGDCRTAKCDVHLIVAMLGNDPLCWDCARGYRASVRSEEEIEKGAVTSSDLAILPCTFHQHALQSSVFAASRGELQNSTASIEATMVNVDKVPDSHVLLQRLRAQLQEPQWPIVLQVT
jgi:hypothetical protein